MGHQGFEPWSVRLRVCCNKTVIPVTHKQVRSDLNRNLRFWRPPCCPFAPQTYEKRNRSPCQESGVNLLYGNSGHIMHPYRIPPLHAESASPTRVWLINVSGHPRIASLHFHSFCRPWCLSFLVSPSFSWPLDFRIWTVLQIPYICFYPLKRLL